MSLKLVVFDLDGTLVNSLQDLAESANLAVEQCGYEGRSLDEVKSFVGNGVRLLIKRALPNDTADDVVEQCLHAFKQIYEKRKLIIPNPIRELNIC